jgi:uncharacterized membrane protein
VESRDSSVLLALGMNDPVVSSVGRQVHRSLQFITQFFIIIGFFKIIIYREAAKLKAEYFYLIAASLVILVLSFLPFFAQALNMTRVYHITLFALSPLFMVGGIFVIEKSIGMINIKDTSKQNLVILILVLSVLIPYFLFNTGFVYEMTNDSPTSMSLGMERMKNYNITRIDFNSAFTPEKDVFSASWYYKYNNKYKRVYADRTSRFHVLNSYGMITRFGSYGLFTEDQLLNENRLLRDHYIFLSEFNVCENTFVVGFNYIVDTSVISPLTSNSSKIYSNGCGEIYEK